jgi:hypothetical protein
MHRDLAGASAKKRQQARKRHAKKTGAQLAKFAIGDFVLVRQVAKMAGKLTLHWRGPARVVRVISDWVMEVQSLVPPHDVSTHHAARLKSYSDKELDVTADLLEHVAFGEYGFHVESLLDVRRVDGQYQVLVKWLGLEASWEPAATLYEDITIVMRRWVSAMAKENPQVEEMRGALEEALGHPLQEEVLLAEQLVSPQSSTRWLAYLVG